MTKEAPKPKSRASTEELLRKKLGNRDTAHNFLIYGNKPQANPVEPIDSKGISDLVGNRENVSNNGEESSSPTSSQKENGNTEKTIPVSVPNGDSSNDKEVVPTPHTGAHEVLTVKKRSITRTFKKVQPKKSDRYTPKTFRVDKEVLDIFERYMHIEHGDYQKLINLSLINAILSDEAVSQRLLNKSISDYNRLIELEEEYQDM